MLGKSIRQISRETEYSRQVIRKVLTSTDIPVYKLYKPKPKPVIDSVKPIILEWLRQDEQSPPKQRHTCVWQNKNTHFGNRKVQIISENEKSLAS